MTRVSIIWGFIALGTAITAFAAAHAWTAAPGDAGAVVANGGPGSAGNNGNRTSAQLVAALIEAATADDPLLRRLRFLELVARAHPSELRRLFLSPRTTQREKRAIAQRWAEVDAPGLLELLKGVSRTEWERDHHQFTAVRGILFRTWASQDPDAAMAAATELSRRPQFRGVQWEITLTLFATDPARAFDLAGNQSRWGGQPIPEAVWKDDPAGFLRTAGEASTRALEHNEVSEAVDSAFSEWLKINPTAASEWLKNRTADQQRALWPRLAQRLAETDPVAAQAWFASLPPSVEREQAGTAIVQAWALKDPQAALAWLQDNLEGGRTEAFTHIAGALVGKGVDSAQQLLDAMPPGAQRDAVVTAIARSWFNKEAKPAMDWLLSLPPDDPGRRRAIKHLHYQWAQEDLASAAAFVAEHKGRGEARHMLWSVPREFAAQDLPGGVYWAASLPEAVRDEAFSYLLQSAQWHDKLPQAFTAMESLPVDQQRLQVENMVDRAMSSQSRRDEEDVQLLRLLRQIPPPLRDTARRAVEAATSATPERRAAARGALAEPE